MMSACLAVIERQLPQCLVLCLICFVLQLGPTASAGELRPGSNKDPKVSLIIGDTQSAATLSAIHQLKADPLTSGCVVRLFVKGELTETDRVFVESSNVVIVYPRFAGLVRSLLTPIKKARENGALIVGVGPTIEAEFVEQGILRDVEVSTYFEAGGVKNLVQMVRCAVNHTKKMKLPLEPSQPWPDFAYFSPKFGTVTTDFERYVADNRLSTEDAFGKSEIARVGILFSRENAVGGDIEVLNSLDKSLRNRGLLPIFAYGYPGDRAIPTLFVDESGKSRVQAVIALTLKIGNVPDKIIPILESLNVPIINAIALNNQSLEQWKSSAIGLDTLERSWQVGASEFAGTISPTVIATRETVIDSATDQSFVLTMPIEERILRITERIDAWIRLQRLEAKEKHLAVVYYNYPPGRESIGASYLNVMPDSLYMIIEKLRESGFSLGDCPHKASDLFDVVQAYASNPPPGENASLELNRLVASKRVQLLPVKTYRQWFDRLPIPFRKLVIEQWGEPEKSDVMTWTDDLGERYFVFPVLRYGNVLLGPQPTRGWQHDIEAVYHDVSLPPHHQYIAFYLWLQNVFKADVCLHVGTHATHEWLPGREVGFDRQDSGEIVVGSIPQLYLYIVDDVGEGLQAKRRGLAAMISHQTPPLDRASLSLDLRELSSLITDYSVLRDKGSAATDGKLREITDRARDKGILKELSIDLVPSKTLNDVQLEEVEHHLKRIGERLTPFGMHTFGKSITEAAKESTIQAIMSVSGELTSELRANRESELGEKLDRSGPAEWASLFNGLRGEYIAAGPGGDPIRNPDVLPTGKNFYGFDPARMPSKATYEVGLRLANEFLAEYAGKHSGATPSRLVFNLWGTESSRHEGVMEAQIFALMGVRPVWDSRGRVQDVELISRQELGRSRVDVTIVPSGLYRDLFAKLMLLMDRAVDVVKQDLSSDNPLLQNIRYTTDQLIKQGIEPELARRLASVRLFSLPSGAYGAGLEHVIQAENSWKNEAEINSVFMNRMSHLFGQGYWGNRAQESKSGKDLSPLIMSEALRGAEAVIHSRSSNVYGAVDSDDFYQYLGGTTMAVRAANGGKEVDAFVADLSNPHVSEVVTLKQYIGQEMRARYFNPKWIEAMLKEGYAGSRMIRQMTDNLWGWQVTVPEAVGDSKWQELFEVYVEDRYELAIQKKFSDADNLAAYEALVTRMQSVIAKGYWNATEEQKTKIAGLLQDIRPAVAGEKSRIENRANLQPAPASIPLIATETDSALADGNISSPSAPRNSSVTANTSGNSDGAKNIELIEMVQGFAMQTETTKPSDEPNPSEKQSTQTDLFKGSLVFLLVAVLIFIGWAQSSSNRW